MGTIDYEYDDAVPRKTAFETFSKKLNVFLKWKSNVHSFFEDLIESELIKRSFRDGSC